MGTGTGSAVGWINLTTCVSSGVVSPRLIVLPLPPFGDPKGDILRVSSARGFNPVSGVLRRGFGRRARTGAGWGSGGSKPGRGKNGPSCTSGRRAPGGGSTGRAAPLLRRLRIWRTKRSLRELAGAVRGREDLVEGWREDLDRCRWVERGGLEQGTRRQHPADRAAGARGLPRRGLRDVARRARATLPDFGDRAVEVVAHTGAKNPAIAAGSFLVSVKRFLLQSPRIGMRHPGQCRSGHLSGEPPSKRLHRGPSRDGRLHDGPRRL